MTEEFSRSELVKMRVDALDQAVDSYLSVLEQQGKWWGWKNQTFKGMVIPYGVWHSAERDGEKRLIWSDRARSMQTGRPGSPDRVGIYRRDKDSPGLFAALELKTGGAHQTEDQKYAQGIIGLLGGVYAVIGSVRDLEEVLEPSPGRQALAEASKRSHDVSDIPF